MRRGDGRAWLAALVVALGTLAFAARAPADSRFIPWTRPETPALAVQYPTDCTVVFRYRPGLTGPAQVRLRDEETIPDGIDDVQEYYLRAIVPQRVAIDLEFQASASLRSTWAVVRETAAYLLK